MSEEIPQWAIEKAHGLLKVESGLRPGFEQYTRSSKPVTAFARYIAAHEQPPVDPDVIAVREILAEGSPSTLLDSDYRNGKRDDAPEFQAALAAYRKHKEAGK